MTALGRPGPQDVPRRVLGIKIRKVSGDLVIGVADQALHLTDSARLLFSTLDGRRTVTDVSQALVLEYGLDETEALEDTTSFLGDLGAQGIVAW
ncbi:hypothetical protein ASD11_17500 [Aeromicrobium sp. Root495]|uniref:PqqD family protein n=1 Tax=Aeromicrobium sp. Root495 TaxID=1736550 RepID=UPI0006F2EF6D|nr:PqqD family protein [Aeromicrobium sp. Root495]KQY55338.1 hypothetical protein ASD11_17500 [Aeromicrobium sp. Root495]